MKPTPHWTDLAYMYAFLLAYAFIIIVVERY